MTTIHNFALSNLKADKTRSILITLTIFMSTLLLMAIATFGVAGTRLSQESAKLDGDYYGMYVGVSNDSILKMERRSEFTRIGLRGTLGFVETEKPLMLYYFDDMALKMVGYQRDLREGTFPIKENEIAGTKVFFALLGYEDVSPGQKINVSFRVDLRSLYETKEFVVSGLLADRKDGSLDTVGLISADYFNTRIEEDEQLYRAFFSLDESLKINAGNADEIMKELAAKCGIDERQVAPNYSYLWWVVSPDPEMLIGCVIVAILIVIFSIIVIYNIFQVGIIKKVQEYGKIKAIGATKKEMHKIVLFEGLFLAVIAIPTGLLAGYLLMIFIFSSVIYYMAMGTPIEIEISYFSFPALIIVACAALSAVVLALLKPMRIVGKIAPVVAMKYQESSEKSGLRKGFKELTIFGLILANIQSQKKRMISSIVMMGLSGVMFVVLANLVGNMDAEYAARELFPDGEFQILLNARLNDTAYPENNLDNVLRDNPLNKALISEIRNIPGVIDLGIRYELYGERYMPAWEDFRPEEITVLNREEFNRGQIGLGEFTYDEVSAQNGLIIGSTYYLGYTDLEVGKQEYFKLFDGMDECEWNPVLMGAFDGYLGALYIITEDSFQNLGFDKSTSPAISRIWIDCNEADKIRVESKLREIIRGINNIEFYAYHEVLTQYKNAIILLLILGYALSLLVGIISFLNIANTIITSVISRKQEFGILQAVGMTNAQLNRCLQLEGLLFTIGTVLVANVIGIPLGYYLFRLGVKNGVMGLHIYQLPIGEIALMIALLTVLQLVLSFVLSRNIKKESLVERIRYQG